MEVRVKFPSVLRFKIGGVSEITVDIGPDGDTVQHVLQQLIRRFPDLAEMLCDRDGRFRPTIQIYLNDEHVRFHQGLHTAVAQNDLVYIVPMVMGG